LSLQLSTLMSPQGRRVRWEPSSTYAVIAAAIAWRKCACVLSSPQPRPRFSSREPLSLNRLLLCRGLSQGRRPQARNCPRRMEPALVRRLSDHRRPLPIRLHRVNPVFREHRARLAPQREWKRPQRLRRSSTHRAGDWQKVGASRPRRAPLSSRMRPARGRTRDGVSVIAR